MPFQLPLTALPVRGGVDGEVEPPAAVSLDVRKRSRQPHTAWNQQRSLGFSTRWLAVKPCAVRDANEDTPLFEIAQESPNLAYCGHVMSPLDRIEFAPGVAVFSSAH